MFNDSLIFILFIIYILCVYTELIVLKRNNISLFYKENFILVLFSSMGFPLALLALVFGYTALNDFSWKNEDSIILGGYFFTFILAPLAYIIHYIKYKIYGFISKKDKLSFLGFKSIYDK